MLTIKEICEQADISLHTFQFWRRHDSKLLPEPVAVKKRVIYFDKSILERIKFIRSQQAAGKNLDEIQAILTSAGNPGEVGVESPVQLAASIADTEIRIGDINSYVDKWQNGNCIIEVCKALGLDQAITGDPVVYLYAEEKIESAEDAILPFRAYVTVVSNKVVHFAELAVDIYKEPVVTHRTKIDAVDYGMMLSAIGQVFVDMRRVLNTARIPQLLFSGLAGTDLGSDFWMKTIKLANDQNRLVAAGRDMIKFLKEHAE